MNQSISVIILSAGKGTRMKSSLPKVMHKVAGREMLNMVIDEAKKINPRNITIVISEEMLEFRENISAQHPSSNINFVIQEQRLGTAHAVSCALKSLDSSKLADKVVILYGDTPLISHVTIHEMLEQLNLHPNNSICILGFENHEKNAYGKLVINSLGNVAKIVEHKDANESEKNIALCNSGVIAIRSQHLVSLLPLITNNNSAQEFYLTDIVNLANQHQLICKYITTNNDEVLGVNSRLELAKIEKIKQKQIRHVMMENGVTLLAPKTVYFNYDTNISADTIIHPHVVFGKNVKIASNVEIKSFCHIEGAEIKSGAVIGPFARIRPETKIAEDVHIGNFVEIKKSTIDRHTKINHLSYIGDSKIGSNTNIGAGTITCNYDGFKKSSTTIGNNVFVGSNSALIAPVAIEDGAIIGAGSVITTSVPTNDLAIARTKQTNIKQGATKLRNSKKPKND